MSVSELSIVSVALIITYVILVYNIKRYFKDHMILEIKSLSILFASFMIAYALRTVYQLFLGYYKNLDAFSDPYLRWWLQNYLWIIWDIVSIVSILVLHHINFKDKKMTIIDPPSRNNSTFLDVNSALGKSRNMSQSN